MAIYKFNVSIIAVIRDTETDAEREEIFTRPLITMHQKGSEMRLELIDVAIDELLEEIEDELLDIEEIKSFKVKVEE